MNKHDSILLGVRLKRPAQATDAAVMAPPLILHSRFALLKKGLCVTNTGVLFEKEPFVIGVWMSTAFAFVVPFSVLIGVLVFVHEMGHYLVARAFGVHVETFAIGFGPTLFSRTDSVGTVWKIGLIPLGGYISLWNRESTQPKPVCEDALTLDDLAPLQKIAVSAAGPFANFFLAFFVFFGLFATVGKTHVKPIVSAVSGIAEEAGVKVGDTILSINATSVPSFHAFLDVLKNTPEKTEVLLELWRDSAKATATFQKLESGPVGICGNHIERQICTLDEALTLSLRRIGGICAQTLDTFAGLLKNKKASESFGGPLRIMAETKNAFENGFYSYFSFLGMLSVSLGLINIVPFIFVLDGGRIVLYAVEWAMRKPLPPSVVSWIEWVGMMSLLALMLFIFANDVKMLWFR